MGDCTACHLFAKTETGHFILNGEEEKFCIVGEIPETCVVHLPADMHPNPSGIPEPIIS